MKIYKLSCHPWLARGSGRTQEAAQGLTKYQHLQLLHLILTGFDLEIDCSRVAFPRVGRRGSVWKIHVFCLSLTFKRLVRLPFNF